MIFLSASIPDPKRDKKYIETADIIAIRDAVRALATVVIPKTSLAWGGHPAITPLIRYVMKTINVSVQDHVILYQSEFFANEFPEENRYFEKVVIIPKNKDRESSLIDMRNAMLSNHSYEAGIFIGGMEGVEEEYKLFNEFHPFALKIPMASTGAAAKIIYDQLQSAVDKRLLNDFAYMALFKSLLNEIL